MLVYAYDSLFGRPGSIPAKGGGERHFQSNLNFRVYSQDLSRLIKSLSVSEGWRKMGRFAVVDLPRTQTRPHPFMVLSDAITVYNY